MGRTVCAYHSTDLNPHIVQPVFEVLDSTQVIGMSYSRRGNSPVLYGPSVSTGPGNLDRVSAVYISW